MNYLKYSNKLHIPFFTLLFKAQEFGNLRNFWVTALNSSDIFVFCPRKTYPCYLLVSEKTNICSNVFLLYLKHLRCCNLLSADISFLIE